MLLFTRLSDAAFLFQMALFWAGPLIFIFLGLAIGLLLLIFIKRKDKFKVLFFSSLISCIAFCVVIVSVRSYDWYRSRYLLNIEANEDFLHSSLSYPKQEQIAFKMLTDKYENANNILLTQVSASEYDSIVNKEKIKAYDIEFVYLRKDVKGHYRSKCTIVDNQGDFQYFDKLLSDSEQRSIDSTKNEGLRQALKTTLADSAKISLDSSTKAMMRTKIKSKIILLDTLSNFGKVE